MSESHVVFMGSRVGTQLPPAVALVPQLYVTQLAVYPVTISEAEGVHGRPPFTATPVHKPLAQIEVQH